MQFSKLDNIVRGILLNKQYTLHWYLQVLKYCTDCLRELNADDLQIINSVVLTLNSYKAATIPADMMDWVRVGVENGPYVKPLTQIEGYNRTLNYDVNGNPQPWPQVQAGLSDLAYFGVPYLTYYVNSYNSRGENVGGLYGFRSDGTPFTFQMMKERNEIQFDTALGFDKIVLDYISDGRSATAASMIPAYAEKTIEDYCDWQLDEHNRSVSDTSKERKYLKYVGSRTGLRSRMESLTTDDIMQIFRGNYTATVRT